ncbi:hypothetical protein KQI79_08955 [Paenibacillus sp. MSJ-34]|nr:hypothetical protein [Paenibacillus sp. MSJ-34]
MEQVNPSLQADKEKYQFTCNNIRIAIAGSDRRTGVTTTAMNLIFWIQERGGTACYVEANTSKHLSHIIHLFDPDKSGNAYVMGNVDFYLTQEFNQDYNFIVIDYELPIFYRALERCKHLPVHSIGMFVPENLKPYLRQMTNQNIIFGDSSHDLFDSNVNNQVHQQILKEYISKSFVSST